MNTVALQFRAITPLSIRGLIARIGRFFQPATDPASFPSIEGTLSTLKKLGFSPRHCVDVGAHNGEWTTLCRSIFPETSVFMIEALESKRTVLTKLAAKEPEKLKMQICLLGAAEGSPVEFTEMGTGSSVYAESSPYARTITQRTTCRLDTVLGREGYSSVDFLKLDVQGYELEILRGAEIALDQATAVLMEASLVPINSGCPLIGEVMTFMDSRGFRLFDFCSQIRRKDGVLWQTDLLFLKRGSSVIPSACLTGDNWPTPGCISGDANG